MTRKLIKVHAQCNSTEKGAGSKGCGKQHSAQQRVPFVKKVGKMRMEHLFAFMQLPTKSKIEIINK